jgi:hypothetical protein
MAGTPAGLKPYRRSASDTPEPGVARSNPRARQPLQAGRPVDPNRPMPELRPDRTPQRLLPQRTSLWLAIDPNFDPLRKNPRFQKLVASVK